MSVSSFGAMMLRAADADGVVSGPAFALQLQQRRKRNFLFGRRRNAWLLSVASAAQRRRRGGRLRERRPGRRRRASSSRAGPDSDEGEPANGRRHDLAAELQERAA